MAKIFSSKYWREWKDLDLSLGDHVELEFLSLSRRVAKNHVLVKAHDFVATSSNCSGIQSRVKGNECKSDDVFELGAFSARVKSKQHSKNGDAVDSRGQTM